MILSPTARRWPPFLAAAASPFAALDKLAAFAAMGLLAAIMASSAGDSSESGASGALGSGAAGVTQFADNETVASVYAGAPHYYRSDLQLTRPDGTDMTLKRLGWDGDAFYFPIDGGARVIRWSGSLGLMVDFLHNKAITRLGRGTHGRKIKNGVVEDVETAGTLKGQPAPSPLHLTDLLERLEFTHGHNVLMLTGLARLGALTPKIRPYFGIGYGVALPHVEVRFTGEKRDRWTNEYQYAGPSFQLLAGLELRSGRGSYYLEYKFVWASIEAALTGGKSWSLQDLKISWLPDWLVEPFVGLTEMPGDLWNQYSRWRSGEAPAEGRISTTLISHQVFLGAGYVWPGTVPAGANPLPPAAP